MGFYQDRVLPWMIHSAMRQTKLRAYRRRVVPSAEGRVLEVGIGSGLNLPFYGEAVESVIGLDPSSKLLSMAGTTIEGSRFPVELVRASAEAMPLDSGSVDTVLTTWTLCTIADAHRALGEMRRVLKPGGRLLFVEHGLAPERRVRAWQDRLTPLWKRIGGGCHLNRPIGALIEAGGFRIDRLETGYMAGPKPLTFMYEGTAHAR